MGIPLTNRISVRLYSSATYRSRLPVWSRFVKQQGRFQLSYDPGWLAVLESGLRHEPYILEASENGEIRGLLPMVLVRSHLFGRYLVGLSYVNYGGIVAECSEATGHLVERAVELAKRLDVRTLELRQEVALEDSRFINVQDQKVHMRLQLPDSESKLLKQIGSKVRNQVRKGENAGLEIVWGGENVLGEFYNVFCRNMRDLGTPVYSSALFRSALNQFPDHIEFCVVRLGGNPIAAAMLSHGLGITEVPSASSLREYNSTCANMLMYWKLLVRAIERHQTIFDFGRSSLDSSTYRFKQQWGAMPGISVWNYHVRQGDHSRMRPAHPRNQRLIKIWRRLPLPLSRLLGPNIVRAIP